MEMQFWGVEVKVGQSVKIDPNDDEFDDAYIHISQIALGEVKKDKVEPVVVYLKVGEQKLVLGTLIKDTIPQISVNLGLEREAELSHNSKNAAVHFSGYKVLRGGDEDFEDSDQSDSDAELAPLRERAQAAKEIAKSGKPAAETGAVAKQVKTVEIKDESDDESDSDFSDESDSDSKDSESEEDTPAKKVDQGKNSKGTNVNAPKAPVPTKKAKIATPEKTDSDVAISDDEDISDEDISDEDISDEDSSDEETPVKKGKNNKRPNEAASQTPVSAKKPKNATPAKTDVKKVVHIATPHPKKGGKTPQNVAKAQTPSSSKSQKSQQGRRR